MVFFHLVFFFLVSINIHLLPYINHSASFLPSFLPSLPVIILTLLSDYPSVFIIGILTFLSPSLSFLSPLSSLPSLPSLASSLSPLPIFSYPLFPWPFLPSLLKLLFSLLLLFLGTYESHHLPATTNTITTTTTTTTITTTTTSTMVTNRYYHHRHPPPTTSALTIITFPHLFCLPQRPQH